MFTILLSVVILGLGAFATAWWMQGRAQKGKDWGQIFGQDSRYAIGVGLGILSALATAFFPPLGLLLAGASGATVGMASAEKRVEVEDTAVNGTGAFGRMAA